MTVHERRHHDAPPRVDHLALALIDRRIPRRDPVDQASADDDRAIVDDAQVAQRGTRLRSPSRQRQDPSVPNHQIHSLSSDRALRVPA
jgi:hypothetical protein